MTGHNAEVLPFALCRRWIVTIENARELVRVRHRSRWYAVARRIGHEDRRYSCKSRADARQMAELLREWTKREEFVEGFRFD